MSDLAWRQLVSTALVGTERRPLPAVTESGAQDALERIGTGEPAVLRAAAILGAYRRCGVEALRVDDPPADDEDTAEDRPECAPSAAQLLELVLTGAAWTKEATGTLVREWCAGCDRHGQRVPFRLITTLLDATGNDRLPAVPEVIGRRGRWLAKHHRRWGWATESTRSPIAAISVAMAGVAGAAGADGVDGADGAEGIDVQQFETAPAGQRAAILRTLRGTDPAYARELLAASWSRESAADRATFVEALADGLGAADEPFLEAALRDRAKGVRAAATALLSRLPMCAYGERMAARVRPLVETGGLLRRRLDVALPESLDDDAVADGIERKPPTGSGERAWWLRQLIAAVPLDRWTEWCDAAPPDLIERVTRADQAEDIRSGWTEATLRQRHAVWAEALFAATGNQVLIAHMRRAEIEARAERALRENRGAEHTVALLNACPTPWRPELADAVLAKVAATPVLFLPVQFLAEGLPPSQEPSVRRFVESLAEEDSRRRQLRNLGQILSVRASILQEFP